MAYTYLLQNGTTGRGIPYPSSAHPNATIATSGCGACASLMALRNMTTFNINIFTWTNLLLKNGCRAAQGTDMLAVCKLMKRDYGFKYEVTADIDKLIKHLKSGYGAVLNVGACGFFSSSGHFVYAAAYNGDKFTIFDPYYYTGKWTATVRGINRSNYFKYNVITHAVTCTKPPIIHDRNGYYYLLTPTTKKKTSAPAPAPVKTTTAKPKYSTGKYQTLVDLKVRKGAGTNYAQKKVKELTADGQKHALDRRANAPAVLRAGTKVTVSDVVQRGTEVWGKIPSGFICLDLNGKSYVKRA